ncbi:MAG: hypothetical protein AB1578_09775 [Thermodesulfobacteriota bacterium]
MKTTARTLYLTAIATVAPAATALAATGTRQDTSGIFVWAFLGFCALIVAAQVVPAILMAIGAAKGAVEGIREKRTAPARMH